MTAKGSCAVLRGGGDGNAASLPDPDINPQYSGAVEAAGDLFGMFKDTPQARALMKYLVTPEAQAIWVQRGGALSPNKRVPADTYPDPLGKQAGQILTSAKIVRFDASDLMPEAMNNAFWKAILDYVQNPGNLDSILANLDTVQKDAYNKTQATGFMLQIARNLEQRL
jgi:alpha-glucoside transport system substrate-binding protein